MKAVLSDVKQIGIKGAISSAVHRRLYETKGKMAITKGNFNALKIRKEYEYGEKLAEKYGNQELEKNGGESNEFIGSNVCAIGEDENL